MICFRKFVTLILLLALLSLSACGFLIYPERRGQTGGKLDATVVLLDAAGLIFGVIPGVVAFAVDIASGAIYLPQGGKSSLEKHLEGALHRPGTPYREVDPRDSGIDPELLAEPLSAQLGHNIEAGNLRFYRFAPLKPQPSPL